MKKINYREILASIDGAVMVDPAGKILLMDDCLAKICWVNGEQMDAEKVIGRDIREVIPTTNIMKTFEEKKTTIDYYFVEGRTIVSTRKPIIENKEIIGALEFDIFGIDGEYLSEFFNRTADVAKDLTGFQKDFSQARYSINAIVGESPVIEAVKEEIRVASKYNSTVLIEGKTGTGKELAAHAIHAMSDRQLAPLIRMNCAAIPESLMESELFGYEAGAFTGGKVGGSIGKIESASGGTILLDEINQLPLSAQPKLLRFLQEHEITRVGGTKSIRLDVRVIATSNEDLEQLVEKGRFREDLYYRLNVINIKIPSLAQRREDIPQIVRKIISRLNVQLERDVEGISPQALDMLQNREWPGNIRELSNVVERAMTRCEGKLLRHEHFKDISNSYSRAKDRRNASLQRESLAEARDAAERQAIVNTLSLCHGNKMRAAEALGVSRSLIHKKIVKYQITEDEYL